MFYHDEQGWLSATQVPGREGTTVPVPSTPLPEGHGWNFTGHEWRAMPLVPVVATPPDPVEDEQLWWIDTGPYKDRLGMDALAIGASTHDACKGVMAMLEGRKYVDLKDPKVGAMLNILIATNQPAANPIFPGSGPMTAAKKTAILTTPTTEKERHIKGL